MEKKLPVEFKTKWVEALRSGEYQQTKEYLHSEGGYCCLGVACELTGTQWIPYISENSGMRKKDKDDHPIFRTSVGDKAHSYPTEADLPPEVWQVLTLPLKDVLPDTLSTTVVFSHLANLNDGDGWTFDEIAKWIEEKL